MTTIVTSTGRLRAVGPVVGLSLWTLFTWVNRVRNVLADPALSGWDRWWSLGVAGTYVTAGAGLGLTSLAWAGRRRGAGDRVPDRVRQAAVVLAVVGALWWAVRAVQIARHDHGLGFKVVHWVLAAVTIALGAVVVRWSVRSAATRQVASLAADG